VNKLIEETYVDMLKKKEKIEGCAALLHSPKTRQKSQGSRLGRGNTLKSFKLRSFQELSQRRGDTEVGRFS
jgi:hypothetical protein